MFYIHDKLVEAYQQEYLKLERNTQESESVQVIVPAFRDRFLLSLGNALISLGEKVKSESTCAELVEGCA
jgi:serine protease inhibitor